MATNNAVNTNLSGQTGTGSFAGSISPTFVTPILGSASATSIKVSNTGILDTNGNVIIALSAVGSAVNNFQFNNQSTTNFPTLSMVGSDATIGMQLNTKGNAPMYIMAASGGTSPLIIQSGTTYRHNTVFSIPDTANTRTVTFPDADGTLLMTGTAISTVPSIAFSTTSGVIGTATNDSAAVGSVGQFITSAVTAQAITSATPTNVTSISLTAGDWDVYGSVFTNPAASTTQSIVQAGINTTTATLPAGAFAAAGAYVANTVAGVTCPVIRLSLSGTTTVFLVANVTYAISTLTINGTLSARRRR